MRQIYHYFYKIKNNINGWRYYGIHSTTNLNDNYLGSGKYLWEDYKKYGKLGNVDKYGNEIWTKKILKFCDSRETVLDLEKKVLNANIIRKRTELKLYNLTIGGQEVPLYNRILVKDKNNTIFITDKDDIKLETGEICAVAKGKVTVIDLETCKTKQISIEDFYSFPEKYKMINKDKISVIDKNGKKFKVDINDTRWVSGELKGHTTGKAVFIDMFGKTLMCKTNDPRILTGEIQPLYKGRCCVVDKTGRRFMINKDDPRYISGEFQWIMKGKKSICPHCGIEGGVTNMGRYHFDNCQFKNIKNYIVQDKKTKKYIEVDKTDSRIQTGELLWNKYAKECTKKLLTAAR